MLEALRQLHLEVDEAAGRLERVHAGRFRCSVGCSSCCVDEITVFEVEAQNIVLQFATLLEEEIPHPEGACAFMDSKGECRIYSHRPYVCRTQGLPLRWLEEDEEEEIFEMRDICPLNDEGEPLEELDEEDCWTIGPFEERLAGLQYRIDGGKMSRVALRDLFHKRSGGT
jgi:uncharacterized protein